MNHPPILRTNRLILRKLEVDDLRQLERLANHRQIARYIVNISYPYTGIQAGMRLGYVTKGFQQNTHYCFAIFDQDRQTFLGEISLHLTDTKQQVAELGYWIGVPFWNQGFATEAIKATLEFGLSTLKLQAIYATCSSDNLGSQRVLIKNGMLKHKETPHQLVFVQYAR